MISHCRITQTKMSGIALYTVDGGDLRNVTVSDMTMDGITLPIHVRLGARLKSFRAGESPRRSPGKLRDVTIRNISAKDVGLVGLLINGIPGYPIESLTLENIRIELPDGGTPEAAAVTLPENETSYPEFFMFGKTIPAYGLYARHVRGLSLKDVQTTPLPPDARPATIYIDVVPTPAVGS